MSDDSTAHIDEAVRSARSTQPGAGVKRLTAQLRANHPEWELNTKAVKESIQRLDAEAAAVAPEPEPTPTPVEAATSVAKSKSRRSADKDDRTGVCDALYTCAACAKNTRGSPTRIMCICTRVVFCSEACEERSLAPGGNHACRGPPPTHSINLSEHISEASRELNRVQMDEQAAYMREMKETVSNKFRFRGGPKAFTLDEMTRCAEQSPACAFQAGIMLKTQMMGTPEYHDNGQVTLHRDQAGGGVLQKEAESIKYFTMAAEAGLGLAMLSLGESFHAGKGVRRDKRRGLCWFWQGTLQDSAGSLQAANQYFIVPLEVLATSESLRRFLADPASMGLMPGQRIAPSGPNIGSLLVALIRPLAQYGFTLPPFAATAPGGNTPTVPRVPLLAQKQLRKVLQQMDRLNAAGYFIEPRYGRRGTSKGATLGAQGTGVKKREIDSQLFVTPPTPPRAYRGNDAPTDEQTAAWVATAKTIDFDVDCVHRPEQTEPGPELRGERSPVCGACLGLALERLAALDHGAVMLSLTETLSGDGQMAIYRSSSGAFVSETFRSYSRPEVESALGALVLAAPPALSHPLFIAQDPNLLWPAVYHHGSVRAALAFVAPYVDWGQRLMPMHSPPEAEPLLACDGVARRCGADACLSLQSLHGEKEERFLKCSGCMRRRYCSAKCQHGDFPLHKTECSGTPKAPQPATVSEEAASPVLDFRPEDHVIIQGLMLRPSLNGRSGVVTSPLSEDGDFTAARHGVEVDGQQYALKPANLLRLGVKCVTRKLGRRYSCSAHGGEVCEVCCLDLTIANHLGKLRHSQGGAPLSADIIERVAQAHFKKMPRAQSQWADGEVHRRLDLTSPLLPGVPEGPANRRAVM